MSGGRPLVLDASVGVKWFKPEPGQVRALEILADAADGVRRVVVPTHFVHEVLSVVQRIDSAPGIIPAWDLIRDAGVEVVPLSDEVVRAAAAQCDALECTFYDALAPAIASLLDGELVSADARAHGAYPGVRLLRDEGCEHPDD